MKAMGAAQQAGSHKFDTALVLGGGGMFGAYQAGVWHVLEREFRPDVVIGASIGSLNGWAIAGGCTGEELTAQWLDFSDAAMSRFRWPRSPMSGCIDRQRFEGFIERHYRRYTPRTPFAVAITRMRGLAPHVVLTPNVRPLHLQASCALPFIMPAYTVDGRWSLDGGLMAAVPLWAATGLGVKRVVAVNILPRGGPWWLRACRSALHAASSFDAGKKLDLEVATIEHASALGSMRETAYWSRESAERMIGLGREDAARALDAVRTLTRKPETL